MFNRLALSLALLLMCEKTTAADFASLAETAKNKAEVLEEKAASQTISKTPPAQLITKPQAQAVDPAGDEPLEDGITCLARTIYWEARGTETAAMEVIANVVMNRVGHEGFPNTICDVVKQGHEQGACQFSWWCDGRPDDAKEDDSYAIAKEIARKALNRQFQDRTHGALYFHDQTVTPDWSKKYLKTAEVDQFIFYKPADGNAK